MPANMHAIRYADDSKYFLGRYLLRAADHENSFADGLPVQDLPYSK